MFCVRPGTTKSISCPPFTSYVTRISWGPSGMWIMNRQNVKVLESNPAIVSPVTRNGASGSLPSVPYVYPDLLARYRLLESVGTGGICPRGISSGRDIG